MPKALKILYLCSEAAPLVKTGGLADVSQALPKALKAQGHDVRVAIPCYGTIPAEARGERVAFCTADFGWGRRYGALRQSVLPGTEVPLYLVEHDQYFGRPHPYGTGGGEYWDNVERFAFFNLGILDGIAATDWRPDLVHCHDWHAALTPAYLKTRFGAHAVWGGMPSLFTIHNLGYQGRYGADQFGRTGLGPKQFTPEGVEFYGDINLMKAGIVNADRLSTVSRRYALEIQTPEYGHGLDGVLRTRARDLTGIVNGVDYERWNPRTDPALAARYSADDPSGKERCKQALRQHLNLPESDAPLFGMVSRLVWQKGLDLLSDVLDTLLDEGAQAVVLGTGDALWESRLREAAGRHPDRFRAVVGYDENLAHRIYAASDFYLMPSRTEPCGLSQLYALAYGAVPVVRWTGGLVDTVRGMTRANVERGRATGIGFSAPTATAFAAALKQALALYAQRRQYEMVRATAMCEDFSWAHSSTLYVRLYRAMLASRAAKTAR